MVRSGWYLGGEILKVIARQIEPMTSPVVRHAWTQLDIPIREWDSWYDPTDYAGGTREHFEDSRNRWAEIMQENNPEPVRVHALRVGDAAICTNPAELYVELGLAIKERSPARVTLISELSDGYCGYVPIPESIRHGGYSAASSSNTRLVPEAGWMIVEETGRLLDTIFAV